MSSQEPLTPIATANHSISPHSSSTPLITSSQRQDLQQAETFIDEKEDVQKSAKRNWLGLKKKENKTMNAPVEASTMLSTGADIGETHEQRTMVRTTSPPSAPLSPSRLMYQSAVAASPSRLRTASPRRLHSPGNSEIFERNVQEPIAISNLQGELSPAHIPAHVITEDSIPPALGASAEAITSNSLNPDEVEIVTSASHEPAASGIEGSTPLHSPPLLHHNKSDDTTSSQLQLSGSLPGLEDDSASSYGQLDPTDVRRLSFISFKDVVQSEHNQMTASALGEPGSRDSLHIHDRTGSPFRLPRSPTSTHSQSINGLTTPPTGVSINPILSTAEQSPARSIAFGSPGSQHGDLNIETMRQALRKTASGDLSGGRSSGMSPVSDAASFRDLPRSRNNT